MAGLLGVLDPRVDQFVLTGAGEFKVLEVTKHPVVLVWPCLRILAAVVILTFSAGATGGVSLLLLLLGIGIALHAGWCMLQDYRDRFVITNQRAMRVNGVFSTTRASVPLSRILDITVNKTVLGHLFHYGHFVFESAAQVQGLNAVNFVADIDSVEYTLRRAMWGQAIEAPATYQDDGT